LRMSDAHPSKAEKPPRVRSTNRCHRLSLSRDFAPQRATRGDSVLKTGIPWEYLPRELGCGSGMTCWRRLHEWMLAGVWQRIHEALFRRLREHDQIMWDRACVDAASVPAPAGGEHTGRNPTDRGKLGSKHHLLVDERGLSLVARISGAQVHDSRFLIPLVESIPAVKGWLAVPANVQVSCMLTERMLREPIGLGCAVRALPLASRATV